MLMASLDGSAFRAAAWRLLGEDWSMDDLKLILFIWFICVVGYVFYSIGALSRRAIILAIPDLLDIKLDQRLDLNMGLL